MNTRQASPVRAQMFVTFGILCVILLAIAGLFFFSLRTIDRANQDQTRALFTLAAVEDAGQDVEKMQAAVLRQLLASDPAEIRRLDSIVREIETTNARDLTSDSDFSGTPQEQRLHERVMQSRDAYWQETQAVLAFGLTNRDADATDAMIARQTPAYDACLSAINDLEDFVEAGATATAANTARIIAEIRIAGDALAGAALVLVLGTGMAVLRAGRRLNDDNRRLQIEVVERKRAAEELHESERRFSDMLRHLELVSMMLDKDLRISYCNDYLLRLTGWQREEVIGRNWADMFLPADRVDEMRGVFSELLADRPAAWHYENEIVTRSGVRRQIRWNNSVLRSATGEINGTASIGEDVTERMRLEAQLLQSQKMETVGKLAGGVAHEFNSIMTAIIGQSELLLCDLPAGSPFCKNATEIRTAANRAAVLTRQLLAYGRKQILLPDVLDVNAILAGMESTLRHIVGQGTDVRIDAGAGPMTVKADAGQLEHVIMQMAMNAADAMPDGGKLMLETAQVTFDELSVGRYLELPAGEYVMLAITDTGKGMSADVKARVFEPFFTTKGVGEGTGLGLSTCYGIVKQSGGHISVYSEPGRGTAFKIYLPQVAPAIAVVAPRLGVPDLPRGTETILLVEDDPALREMATGLLRRLGYTVLSAANGIEALDVKRQPEVGHIDLLFTDVVMPHMSGKELADRLRALHPYTRILFTSAYTEHAAVQQGALNKGVPLLQKPFTPSALAHRVRAILDEPR